MSALVNTLYPLPELRRDPLSVLRWWEARRLRYNLVVGSAGLATLSAFYFAAAVVPLIEAPDPVALLWAPLLYGALANVCYTLGWVTEMVSRLVWGARAPLIGPLLFREGLIFSVGLTLLPVIVLWLRLVLEVVLALTS